MADARPSGNLFGVSTVAGGAAFVLALIALRLRPLLVCISTGVATAIIIVPGMLRACCGGNEATAIGSLRAINSAEAAYASSCAGGAYATQLEDLVTAPEGSSQGFISPDLPSNGVTKSGYVVSIAKDASSGAADMSSVTPCNGATGVLVSSYFAKADPVTPGGTGTRYFATDTRGTIFFSSSGPVPNPIPPDALVAQ